MKNILTRPLKLTSTTLVFSVGCLLASIFLGNSCVAELKLEVKQLTRGPRHHFFGYIGQSLTTPWNGSGKYILALRTSFHDRMPESTDAADVVLLDTHDNFRVVPIEKTRAWNFQQGTMFYWDPNDDESRFFFNDRDPKTQQVFTVLYDIQQRRRIREFRFEDVPVGNGGVSPTGEFFLAINYGRMARLRPVTGYPDAADPTAAFHAPDNDGIFKVDIATGRRQLLVSFRQLKRLLADRHDKTDDVGFYINHSLSSRDGTHVYFYARGIFLDNSMAINVPCSIRTDGTGLRAHQYIGGHPEWDEGTTVIGAKDGKQVRYDVRSSEIVGQLGNESIIPSPGGDIALSRDAQWFANGYSLHDRRENRYVLLQRRSGFAIDSPTFSRGPYMRGPLRIDPAPRWNRQGNAILVPGIVEDGTRQLHQISILDN